MLRGVVEGFYGPPWTFAQRLDQLRFFAEVGFDTYVYAPKDDAFHRARWREPYPAEALHQLAELAENSARRGVRLVLALHPALDMRFADELEHEALAAKAAQLQDAGVYSFALLFDDVALELSDPDDRERFGAGPAGAGAAHGRTCVRFAESLRAGGAAELVLACPTDYAGTARSPYRDAWAHTAPAGLPTCWTGRDVVVPDVTRAEVEDAAASYGRPIVLWDNFPVNDFDPSRLFLGPLVGRPAELLGPPLVGVLSNPMVQALPSRFALGTVAEWLRDPAGYRSDTAAASALMTVAGGDAQSLAPLVRVSSSWPPSADRDPQLSAACVAALDGDREALELVHLRLGELVHGARSARRPAALVAALGPWLSAAEAIGRAGLLAVALLRDGDDALRRRETRAALDVAEDRYPDVLRTVVPPFVRAVLDRSDPQPAATVGERFTTEFLAARRLTGVVVVTPDTPAESATALGRRPVPLVAWGRYAELAMATDQRSVVSRTSLRIEATADPAAAGLVGAVAVHRGPGRMTTATVGEHARVVAREADGGAVAVFRYDAGDPLVDGAPAPAARIGLFLGPDGPAPWLLSDAGRAVVAAACAAAQTEST